MENNYRKSGIDTLNNIPWGTHICQIYQTKDDLIDILVPYFKAGLENNEFCMWVTSEPLGVKEAKALLGKAVRHLNDYISKGQIEILDYSEWYTKSGKFNTDEVLQGLVEKEREALEKGFDGLRLTGNTFWLGAEDWVAFSEYETIVDSIIGEHRVIAICSYSLDRCGASEVLDILNNHEVTIIKQSEGWRTVESDEQKRLKKVLNASEVRFRRLFETARDGILILDADTGQIMDVNPFLKDMLGYTTEELVGKRLWEIGLFKDILKSEDAFKELQREGYIRYEDLQLETKDGKPVDVEFVSNVYDINHEKIIQCNIREISERKKAEEVSEQYKGLLENLVKQRTSELAESNRELLHELTEHKQGEERIIHLNSVLRALREINQLITHGPNSERLIQQSCDIMVKTRGFLCAWILLFDEKRKFVSAAVAGGKETQAFYKQLKLGNYPPCVDKILAQKDSFAVCGDIVENGLDCLLWNTYRESRGLISRLEYEGKVYGIISTYIQSDYVLDPEEQSLFRELAGDIAYALYRIEGEEKQKQAEEEIERLARFPSENPNPVLRLTHNGQVMYANQNSQPLLEHWKVKIGGYVKEPLSELIKQVIRDNRVLETEVELKGKEFSCFIAPVSSADYVNIYGIDITERKQAEKNLRIAEQNFRNSLEDSPLGIRIVTADGELLYANKTILDLYGYSSVEELRTIPTKERYTPQSYAEHQRRKELRKSGKPVLSDYEVSIVRKDGEIRHLSVTRKEVIWNGKAQFQSVYQDITERMKMQAQLIMQDRLASIGQLVSGIAHELNNPLTGVIGFSDLLLARKLPDDVKADLKIINDEAKRTAKIVKNLLTFARRQSDEKQAVSIHESIQAVMQLRTHEQSVNNIQVNTHFASGLLQIMGNGSQLQQVFFNIVINAEFFMLEAHGKGTLTITTERIGDFVRASFADDGPGISKENMEHLFSPFCTTKEVGKGTGLGLSICLGIITEHGGRIWAESELGKGATFIIELPAYDRSSQEGGTK